MRKNYLILIRQAIHLCIDKKYHTISTYSLSRSLSLDYFSARRLVIKLKKYNFLLNEKYDSESGCKVCEVNINQMRSFLTSN